MPLPISLVVVVMSNSKVNIPHVIEDIVVNNCVILILNILVAIAGLATEYLGAQGNDLVNQHDTAHITFMMRDLEL